MIGGGVVKVRCRGVPPPAEACLRLARSFRRPIAAPSSPSQLVRLPCGAWDPCHSITLARAALSLPLNPNRGRTLPLRILE